MTSECKLINAKKRAEAVDVDVHRVYLETFDPFILAEAGENGVEVLADAVNEERISIVQFPSYYPTTV